MARAGKPAPPPPDVTHDSVGGGGAETASAKRIAYEHAIEAMQTLIAVMRAPGRNAVARIAAAKEILHAAGLVEADLSVDSGDLDLSPADVELMKRFLAEREAKGQ